MRRLACGLLLLAALSASGCATAVTIDEWKQADARGEVERQTSLAAALPLVVVLDLATFPLQGLAGLAFVVWWKTR